MSNMMAFLTSGHDPPKKEISKDAQIPFILLSRYKFEADIVLKYLQRQQSESFVRLVVVTSTSGTRTFLWKKFLAEKEPQLFSKKPLHCDKFVYLGHVFELSEFVHIYVCQHFNHDLTPWHWKRSYSLLSIQKVSNVSSIVTIGQDQWF